MTLRLVVLLLVAAGLGVALVWQLTRPSGVSEDDPAAPVLPALASAPPPGAAPRLPAGAQARARPLFSPDRRPPLPKAAPPPEPPKPAGRRAVPPPAGYRATGVAALDDAPVALLELSTGPRRVYVGDEVEGWRVAAIDALSVLLVRGDVETRLVVDPDAAARNRRPP